MNCFHFWCNKWSSRVDYARLLIFVIISVMTDYQTKTHTQRFRFYSIDHLAPMVSYSSSFYHWINVWPLPTMANCSSTNICSCEPSTSIQPAIRTLIVGDHWSETTVTLLHSFYMTNSLGFSVYPNVHQLSIHYIMPTLWQHYGQNDRKYVKLA